jgi:3-phenylpropionate/trans-cinnamate dioxygenase ferredoxin subunit
VQISVGKISDYEEDKIKSFKEGDADICVVKHQGEMHAFRNSCPHQHMPLDMGLLKKGHIVCTLHGWIFDLKTGGCGVNPSCTLPVYTIQEDKGELTVHLS